MNRKGFSLVEVVVASVILALLASGVFSVMISARYLVGRTRDRARAVELARQQIEQMRQLISADQWNLTTSPIYPGSWSGWSPAPGASNYEYRYKVSTVVGAECRQVTIQVRWNETRL